MFEWVVLGVLEIVGIMIIAGEVVKDLAFGS